MSQKEKIPPDSLTRNQKNVVTLKEQIRQFAEVRRALISIKGLSVTKKYLSKSLFFISVGSNDIFGYFQSTSSIPKDEFLSTLLLTYENHLTVNFVTLFSCNLFKKRKKNHVLELNLTQVSMHGRVY